MNSFFGTHKEIKLVCKDCKKPYTEQISSSENSCEAECHHCGTWNYAMMSDKNNKPKVVKLKVSKLKKEVVAKKETTTVFKKGDKVKVEYVFSGKVSETSKNKIHSIKNGIIYLNNTSRKGEAETSVYYDLKGMEKDGAFYPNIYSRIKRAS